MKITITPIDPLISRDSRPFGQGQGTRIRSLDWLTPSVLCGALRTGIGKIHGNFEPEALKAIEVRGPFLECGKTLYFPRPLDFVTDQHFDSDDKEEQSISGYVVRPLEETWETLGGTDLPLSGLRPACVQNPPEQDFKPKKMPGFWSAAAMGRWLFSESPRDFSLLKSDYLSGPKKDDRTHVKVDFETGVSEDSFLFSTTGLDFRVKRDGKVVQTTVALDADTQDESYREHLERMCRSSMLQPLGGERRLAEWRGAEKDAEGWSPSEKPDSATRLRMVLATPAIFSKGWLPGWIDEESREGVVPGSSVTVRLVSAVLGRWKAVSGWSYEKGKHGPKPLRRMVPAGSVYFFEIAGNRPFDWEALWLRSVCDGEQDRKDGFGSALWGVW
ncbi:MAG: type III-B CRISPR module-associated protein Cmr3 [Synergistaceae bacterium]|jgi:CRISPR-associated protein Cmr3|nr:type III-B CRISPR module-associated protein Cmr3 [Synergistaceae bacterium]